MFFEGFFKIPMKEKEKILFEPQVAQNFSPNKVKPLFYEVIFRCALPIL